MKRSNLVRMDNAFLPFYWLLKQLKSIAPRKNQTNDQVVILKFFGVGSMTRIASVIRDSRFDKRVIFLTLKRNKAVIDLLNLNAIYINDKNPLVLFLSAFKRVFTVWKLQKAEIIDMERSSNIAGAYSLMLSIRKKHAQFKLEGDNVEAKNRRVISLDQKASTVGIAEILNVKPSVSQVEKSYSSSIRRIVINMNAGGYLPERKFPQAKWLELLKGLVNKYPEAMFYFSGLESEKEDVLDFCSRASAFLPDSRYEVVAGKQSLGSFVDFLKGTDLFLTNDSGPLHLAHYFGVRTVAIWGPTSSFLVGYPDSSRMLNMVNKLPCAPCFVSPKSNVAEACKGKLSCFQEMNIEMMLSKIDDFVANEIE